MSSKERKALGRGFSALLKPVEVAPAPAENAEGILHLDLDEIALNPRQPRHEFHAERLEELAQSIRAKGVIQPILVRRLESGEKAYELVAGERRLRASRLAGFDKIPALVRPIKDKELLELALIENIQRSDLNPLEEALAYKNLLEEHGYTQADLAKRVGRQRSTIANQLRLLQLPTSLQVFLTQGQITTGHARALLSLEEDKLKDKLCQEIMEAGLSVRQAEQRAKELQEVGLAPAAPPSPPKSELAPQLRLVQDRLAELFSTKVSIRAKGEKGKIELEYYGDQDFNRLYALLLKLAQEKA